MRSEQQYTIGGKTYSVTNWCKIQRVNKRTAICRLMRGCTPEQAFGVEPMPPKSSKKRGLGKRMNHLDSFDGLQVMYRPIVDNAETGKNARAIRTLAGKTLDEVGVGMGLSRRIMHLLEAGKMRWNPDRVKKFNAIAATWVAKKEDQ